MKIYLVRHAIAESHSAPKPDAERALTEEGRTKMKGVARGLRALDVDIDLVLTSPLRRARETAEILAEELGGLEIEELAPLASGGSPSKVMEGLRPHRKLDSIALVGHEPDLGQLASFLLTGSPSTIPLPFKKGGIACVEAELLPGVQRCTLEWFMTPKQLRLLGND